MTKFAILRSTKEERMYEIQYYGGDKGIFPPQYDGEILDDEISHNGIHGLLKELSKKGYMPQCQCDTIFTKDGLHGDIFFIKKGLLNRLFGL